MTSSPKKKRANAWAKTPAGREYYKKYSKENYKNVSIRLRPEVNEKLHSIADKYGLTLTTLILSSVDYYNNHVKPEANSK